jgi:hypothetical protein
MTGNLSALPYLIYTLILESSLGVWIVLLHR